MRPPSEIRPAKRNNKYVEKTLQELTRKVAMMMANPSRTRFASNLQSPNQIKFPLLQPCAQTCRKLPSCALPPQYTYGMDLKQSRMVRVGYFTTLTKLGLGTEEYFTSLLISRVCLLKTRVTEASPPPGPEPRSALRAGASPNRAPSCAPTLPNRAPVL